METRVHRPTALLTNIAALLLIVAVIAGVFVVSSQAFSDEVLAHARVEEGQLSALPDDVVMPSVVRVGVRVSDPSAGQRALAATKDLAFVGLFAAGLWLILGVLRTARVGDPFVAPNVRRLRGVGYLLVLGAPAVHLLTGLADSALIDGMGLDTAGVDVGLPIEAIVAGLGVFVLAQVFAQGVRLREDVEGTV